MCKSLCHLVGHPLAGVVLICSTADEIFLDLEHLSRNCHLMTQSRASHVLFVIHAVTRFGKARDGTAQVTFWEFKWHYGIYATMRNHINGISRWTHLHCVSRGKTHSIFRSLCGTDGISNDSICSNCLLWESTLHSLWFLTGLKIAISLQSKIAIESEGESHSATFSGTYSRIFLFSFQKIIQIKGETSKSRW